MSSDLGPQDANPESMESLPTSEPEAAAESQSIEFPSKFDAQSRGRIARWLARWRELLASAALIAAICVFAVVAFHHVPWRFWLLSFELPLLAFVLLFAAAVFSSGVLLQKRILPAGAPTDLRIVVGLSLGVLLFVFGFVVFGVAGALGHVFFFVWPLTLVGLGARDTYKLSRHVWRKYRRFGFALVRPRGAIESGAAILTLLSVLGVFLQIIVPGNLGADAHWYHLPIAEHYASAGRIEPFREGWYLGAYPQLASLLYAWAFLAPGKLATHVALSSHLEFFLFLLTLGMIPSLVRRLVGGVRAPWSMAALFAFPGVFLYDSSLVTMADHILAFWAVPVVLAALLLERRFDARSAALIGLLAGGAALTKYQGIYIAVPAALWVVALAARALWRKVGAAQAALVTSIFGGAFLLAWAPHWLKNLIFYHDPMYPLLHRFFPSQPMTERATEILAGSYFPQQFALHGTFWERVGLTLGSLFNFSFYPHDWWDFHHDRPVFGSLFTLMLLGLLFVKVPRRLWMTIAAVHLSLGIWFVSSHQDRFLQSLLPVMAAATAAGLIVLWRHPRARIPLAALVTFQLVYGADVYFLPAHVMIGGSSPIKPAVDRIAGAHAHQHPADSYSWGMLERLGHLIPKRSRVLVHDFTEKLGLGAPAVADGMNWQGAIDYLSLTSPESVLNQWRNLGVTHAAYRPGRGSMRPDELAREMVFASTVLSSRASHQETDGYDLVRLDFDAAKTELTREPFQFAWLGCDGDPPIGLYTAEGLARRAPERKIRTADLSLPPFADLDRLDALVLRPNCPGLQAVTGEILKRFERFTTAGDVTVYARRRATP